MNNSDLHQLRRRLDGCELVTFVDVTAGTTLLSSSAVEIGQEHLDTLCDMAIDLLKGDAGDQIRCCIVADPEAVRYFLRETAEALCLVLAPNAILDGVGATAREVLQNDVRTASDV